LDAHSVATSPITGVKVDYSFHPARALHAHTCLRRFFVAMSVLGQEPFCLPGTLDCLGACPARPGSRRWPDV
jgi:hypothetical protein